MTAEKIYVVLIRVRSADRVLVRLERGPREGGVIDHARQGAIDQPNERLVHMSMRVHEGTATVEGSTQARPIPWDIPPDTFGPLIAL